jgi:outer membrane protein assembly factor BamA
VIILAGLFLSAAFLQDAPPRRDSVPPPRFTALPLVSYSDVTGLQYGGTLFGEFRAGSDTITRASTASLYAAATVKGHAKVHTQLDRWSPRNAARFRARVEYISYPLPFYGIGSATPDSAEEWYSSGVTTVQLFWQRAMGKTLFTHIGARYVRSQLRDVEPGGLLEQGAIFGSTGSEVLIGEAGYVRDSRDHPSAPHRGVYAKIIASIGFNGLSGGLGGNFFRYTLDARRYLTLGSAGVLAWQLQYDFLFGNGTPPFDLMPMIGADTAMRGYPRGRYRDGNAATMQGEWRSAHWRRVGLVAFAGAGSVWGKHSGQGFSVYPTGGAGLRYVLSPRERTVLRADFGVGRTTFGLSVGIGEAF